MDKTRHTPTPPTAFGSARFWQDRPTLVTGAAGFLGGHLVRRLVEFGANVVCLVRDWAPRATLFQEGLDRRVHIVWGDLRDQLLLERVLTEYETQSVFHLAAQSQVGVAKSHAAGTFEANVAGTWTLLEACRRNSHVRQIVVASSDKAYGDADRLPYDEETPLRAIHPYDVSKACAEWIARSYAATYQLPVVITRCGNFYGPGDWNWNRIVPGTIRSLFRGERPLIRSDGKYIRDFLYVEDGAAVYTLLAEQLAEHPELAGEAFNFSNEQPLTVLELVERICRMYGSSLLPIVLNQATHEIRAQHLSSAKSREKLGWRPLFSLSEGLARTIPWYRHQLAQSTASPAPAAKSA